MSQQDYKDAKRFDFDGNGIIDPSERQVAQRILSEEFFQTHSDELSAFDPNFTLHSHRTNVNNLANSYKSVILNFFQSYNSIFII